MLNPETNSLSPSAKSNGERLVSAKQEINHIKNTGKNIKKYGKDFFKNEPNLYLNSRLQGKKIMIIRETSYEIVWAAPRTEPNKAYLDLDPHPEPSKV